MSEAALDRAAVLSADARFQRCFRWIDGVHGIGRCMPLFLCFAAIAVVAPKPRWWIVAFLAVMAAFGLA